jgi:pimeloyl-ACP methyl ester carboxylesterase
MSSAGADGRIDMTVFQRERAEGYAPVNGVDMYWRSVGEGGTPLVVVHGGFGTADMYGDLPYRLAEGRR